MTEDPHCDYCEEGVPREQDERGWWHVIVDPEDIEGTWRVPCTAPPEGE